MPPAGRRGAFTAAASERYTAPKREGEALFRGCYDRVAESLVSDHSP